MLKLTEHDSIVEIQMDRPPVNAMNLELVDTLIKTHNSLVKNGAQAIVISGKEGLFSAGLDVPELLGQSRNAMTVFWDRFFVLMQTLLGSKAPVVAAITGHAPAGGAVLAIHCDYRVATAGDFRIGLNEVQVGLPVPSSVLRVLQQLIGARKAAMLAVSGTMVSPQEALSIGMVDEVVEPGATVEAALAYARHLTALPPMAMNATRLEARADLLNNKMNADDVRVITDYWFSKETQETLRKLVEKLRK